MRDKIIDIIVKVSYDKSIIYDNNIDLVESGILDSLAFINLMAELEDEFDIEIQPTQIPSSTWKTLDGIVKLVESKVSKNKIK